MEEVISLKGVSKKFKKNLIFEDVNLSINEKDIFGILGPSGGGKSVLIKIILNFIQQDKGSVRVKRKIGFSMQNNSFYENLTLIQNLNYFAKMYNVKNKDEKIKSLISTLALEGYENTRALHLSGGTRKRADLACALLNDPDILILDEPFSGLDSFLVKQLSDFLKQLKEHGMTIILSSHLLNQVENLCNKFIFINKGTATMLAKGQLKKLYQNAI